MSSMRSLSGSRNGSRTSSRIGVSNSSGGGGGGGDDIKSTVFYPVSMSTMSRYDIVNHMNSHYKRINGAKAAVDTTPPRSYLSRCSPQPGSSRTNSRASSATRHGDVVEIDQRQREAIVRTSSRINFYLDALRLEQRRLLSQVSSQNAPFRRSASNTELGGGRPDSRRYIPPPDLIDRHSEQFTTSERLFVPRLLKTTATSRLREYRWYNSPKRKRDKRRESEDTTTNRTVDDSNEDLLSNATRSKQLDDSDHDEYGRVVLTKTSDLDSDRHSYVVDRSPRPRIKSSRESRNAVVRRSTDNHKSNGRVLKQVLRNHVDKRRNELNVDEMEKILKKLQDDLGISDDEEGNSASFGYGRRRKETTIDTRRRDDENEHSRSVNGRRGDDVDEHFRSTNGRRGDDDEHLSSIIGRCDEVPSKWSSSSLEPSTQTKKDSLKSPIRNGTKYEKEPKGSYTMTISSSRTSVEEEEEEENEEKEFTRRRLEGLQLENEEDDDSSRFFDEDHF